MASRTNELELGNEVLKRERALASEKLKDMKNVFGQLSKMMDAASELYTELDKFTKKYGMNKQAIDELFGLSSQQLALIRSAKPISKDAAKPVEQSRPDTPAADVPSDQMNVAQSEYSSPNE